MRSAAMPAYDRGRHSAVVGSRAPDRGGLGVCDATIGADAGAKKHGRHSGARVNERTRNDAMHHVISPTIAPIRQVVIVPETIDFSPSELISSRRSGAMVPRPPIMMPRLAKLANPHIA